VESREPGGAEMPRLFYKAIVGIFFAIAFLVAFGIELLAWWCLIDRYGSILAWAAFVLLNFVDCIVVLVLWAAAAKAFKQA
jgi:hypothetical protein